VHVVGHSDVLVGSLEARGGAFWREQDDDAQSSRVLRTGSDLSFAAVRRRPSADWQAWQARWPAQIPARHLAGNARYITTRLQLLR